MNPDEFWSRVDVRGPDECWPWKRATIAGYGAFKEGGRKGKLVRASRRAYELTKGPLGKMLACHTCDNPSCCNPAHLFAGTVAANNRDRANKGRSNRPTGERNPQAKLSDEQRAELLRLRKEGVPFRELGRRLSISWASAWETCKNYY